MIRFQISNRLHMGRGNENDVAYPLPVLGVRSTGNILCDSLYPCIV